MSGKVGTHFLHLACQGDGSRSCPPIRYTTGDICGMYLIWHIIITVFILWICRESHNIVCSTAHVCNKSYGKMYSSKHCS